MQVSQAADLKLTRIQLRFENNRATLTVKSRQPDVTAYADIHFIGQGLLRGYWQVDGRLISQVLTNLGPEKRVTLNTPLNPALPTFSEGPHIVMLVINEPAQAIAFPKALYYVLPGEAPVVSDIDLIQPVSGIEANLLETIFQWETLPKVETYLIEFTDDNPQKPLFAAVTERPEYAVPQAVLKYHFFKKQTYFWRVKGLDSTHNIIAESPMWTFRLK
jgi:hypothetical protein